MRCFLTLGAVLFMSLMITALQADDQVDYANEIEVGQDAEQPEQQSEEATEQPKEDATPSPEEPATLSIKPNIPEEPKQQEITASNALPSEQDTAKPQSPIAVAKDHVKQSFAHSPVLWSILGLIVSAITLFFGKKGVTVAYRNMAKNTSHEEAIGALLTIGGIYLLLNTLVLGFGWSFLFWNFLITSLLVLIVGLVLLGHEADKNQTPGTSVRKSS